MTTDAEREANITLVRRVAEEVFNLGNLAFADEAFVPDISAPLKQNVGTLRAACPDLHITIEDALAIDDKVVIRATVRCTHTGAPYWGKPASGKEATWGGIDIMRISNGTIVELWPQYNYLALLQQLGVLPSYAEVVAANAAAAAAPARRGIFRRRTG
jgi:predicted ester cyclase